jgi:hypothetical protein
MSKQIDKLKMDLYKSFFNPHQQRSVRNRLQNLKAKYNKYYSIRHSMDHITLEGFCENLKNQYILYNSLFIKNKDYVLIDKNSDIETLTKEINKYSIDISIFRKIARGDIWKAYWSANKNFIFDKPVTEWTDEQRTLVVFTKMYESARESPESPPDPVFDDDDMFDGWLLIQNEKHKDSKKSINNNNNDKMSKSQEMFVVAKNVDDAQQVHDMNTAVSKALIRERNNAIKNTKDLDASKLPDAKREIQKQSQEMFKNRFKRKK